jgi:shikimate 5-dehydrogenase
MQSQATAMKRIIMIGTPLIHVRSPGILNPMLRAAGQDAEVATCEIGEEELDEFVKATRGAEDVLGLIVQRR